MEEWMYRSTFFFTTALVGGKCSASSFCRLTPDKGAPGTHWIGGLVDLRRYGEVKILESTVTQKRKKFVNYKILQEDMEQHDKTFVNNIRCLL
jgi:hypothetical protein